MCSSDLPEGLVVDGKFKLVDEDTNFDLTATFTVPGRTETTQVLTVTIKDVAGGLSEKTLISVFSNKSWGATSKLDGVTTQINWESVKEGYGFTGGQGTQITAKASGAGAKLSGISNIQSIEIMYTTNSSKGAGTIVTSIGNTQLNSFAVSKSGGTTPRTAGVITNTTNLSGDISIVVNCTANSIYIYSIKIIYLG